MAELKNITMPKWGLSMTTGTVTGWRVGVGDTVTEGAPALDVATEKIEGEVESPVSGVVRRIIADEDDLSRSMPKFDAAVGFPEIRNVHAVEHLCHGGTNFACLNQVGDGIQHPVLVGDVEGAMHSTREHVLPVPG